MPGALDEELGGCRPGHALCVRYPGGVGHGERPHRVLPLAPHAQGRPARPQDPQRGAGGKQRGDLRRGFKQVLQVVEHEQHALLSQVPVHQFAHGLSPGLPQAQHPGDGGDQEGRLGDGGQRREGDAVGEPVSHPARHLQGQARLADAARAGKRN